jgi:hypothetical protein
MSYREWLLNLFGGHRIRILGTTDVVKEPVLMGLTGLDRGCIRESLSIKTGGVDVVPKKN